MLGIAGNRVVRVVSLSLPLIVYVVLATVAGFQLRVAYLLNCMGAGRYEISLDWLVW